MDKCWMYNTFTVEWNYFLALCRQHAYPCWHDLATHAFCIFLHTDTCWCNQQTYCLKHWEEWKHPPVIMVYFCYQAVLAKASSSIFLTDLIFHSFALKHICDEWMTPRSITLPMSGSMTNPSSIKFDITITERHPDKFVCKEVMSGTIYPN